MFYGRLLCIETQPFKTGNLQACTPPLINSFVLVVGKFSITGPKPMPAAEPPIHQTLKQRRSSSEKLVVRETNLDSMHPLNLDAE